MAKFSFSPMWLAGMLVCWGTTAAAMAAVNGLTSLFVLRLLLGVFEAGSQPCMW